MLARSFRHSVHILWLIIPIFRDLLPQKIFSEMMMSLITQVFIFY